MSGTDYETIHRSAYQVVNERFNAAVIASSNRIKEIHKEPGSDSDLLKLTLALPDECISKGATK